MNHLPVSTLEEWHAFFKTNFPLPEKYQHLMVMTFQNMGFEKWYHEIVNCRCFVPLADFKKYYDTGMVSNFVYDRSSGTVFLNFAPGHHDMFMATMNSLYLLSKTTREPTHYDEFSYPITYFGDWGADQYVSTGKGFFKSSCSKHICKDEKMLLTFQEKRIFSDYIISNV